jgi:hypothetical protein
MALRSRVAGSMVFRRFKFNGRHILVITVSVMSIIVKSLSYDVVKKMT